MPNKKDNDNVDYPKGENAFYKHKFLDDILDSIGEYEIESRSVETYRKMKDDDAQVASAFEILVMAVLAKGYEINYHGKNNELGDEMVNFLKRMYSEINTSLEFRGGFTYAQREMMSAIWAGFHTQEVVWYYNEQLKKVMVKKLKPLPPETVDFLTDNKGNLTGVYQNYFIGEVPQGASEDEKKYGINIPLNRALIWSYKKEGSSYRGRSDFDSIYKYWYLKDFILKFWSIFTERYGAPFLFGTTKRKRMQKFSDALKNIITRTEMVGMDGDSIKILETAHDGNHFQNFIEYCDIQITKGMLIPNLLLDSGKAGSRALGETQFGFLEWRVNSVQRQLEYIWNLLNKQAIDFNFKDVDSYPVLNYKPLSDMDRRIMAQTFDLLIKNNVVHPVETWVRELMKLPEADPEIIEALEQAWAAKAQKGSAFSPEAGISPWAGDNRVKSPSALQLAERFKERYANLKLNDIEYLLALVQRLDKQEAKLAKKLKPRIDRLMDAWVEKVEDEMKLSIKDENMTLQDYPTWIDGLTPIGDPKLSVIFSDWYDDSLYDSVIHTESELVSIGMKPSFTVRTKVGRIKWIEENLAGLREGGQAMGAYGAGKIPIQMYEFVQPYLKEAYAEGLQPEQIISGLKERLGNHYSDAYLRNVARTNMTAAVNSSRMSLYRKRDDFVKGVEFQSIIDDRTTKICEQLDGQTFTVGGSEIESHTPPLHYMCRSILSPITTLDIPEGEDFIPTYDPADITATVQEGFGGLLTELPPIGG